MTLITLISPQLFLISPYLLCNKIEEPEFLNQVTSNDIFAIVETKLDNFDLPNITVPNYKFMAKNRTKFKYKSGGIGIFVKNDLYRSVKILLLESDIESCLWLLLDKSVCGFQFILGVVYIPPESSHYSNIVLFDALEDDIIRLCNPINDNNIPICLCGDFNVWCGQLSDVVDIADNSVFDFSTENTDASVIYDNLNSISNLDALGIQVSRNCMQKRTNRFGHRLIELCKNTNLFIANGRLKGDHNQKFTCKDIGIVDYFIMSPEILCKIEKFEVLDFDPLFSDAHNLVQATFKQLNVGNLQADPDLKDDETNNCPSLNTRKIRRPKLKPEH